MGALGRMRGRWEEVRERSSVGVGNAKGRRDGGADFEDENEAEAEKEQMGDYSGYIERNRRCR